MSLASFNIERQQKITLLYQVLLKYDMFTKYPSDKQLKILQTIETGVYDYAREYTKIKLNLIPTFENMFKDVYHIVLFNKLLTELEDQIYEGNAYCYLMKKIDVATDQQLLDLAKMTEYELNPFINNALYTEKKLKNEQKVIIKTSANYTCEKCGCNEVIGSREQRRSLDEGYTILVECVKCAHNWTV